MIRFEQLSFTYPGAGRPALDNLTLHIPPGELVLITGHSGSGKSTFLRCLNGLVPHFSGGCLSGKVRVAGLDPVQAAPKMMSRKVGFVFQDPESQFVMDTVEDDILFTLENAGVAAADAQLKVSEALAQLHIERLRRRKIHTLSGGERQRVAVASAIVNSPEILALDEPTSQLDPQAAKDLLEIVQALKTKLRLTVLLVEHRLERVLAYADRLVYFDAVREIVVSGPPRQVLPSMDYHPPLVQIGLRLGWQPLPLSIEQARPFIDPRSLPEEALPAGGGPVPDAFPALEKKPPVLEIENLHVTAGKTPALQGLDLQLRRAEILALIGENGAGKTTLLRTVVGLLKPSAGRILLQGEVLTGLSTSRICRQVAYLPQDPNALLFAENVTAELLQTLKNHNLPVDERWLEELLARLGLSEEAASYPRDLSVGQRQRIALGAILVTRPQIILLDEPTRGLDFKTKQELFRLLTAWRSEGKSILLVTHDVELVASTADRVAILQEGRISASGAPSQTLARLGEFAPQLFQLFPDQRAAHLSVHE